MLDWIRARFSGKLYGTALATRGRIKSAEVSQPKDKPAIEHGKSGTFISDRGLELVMKGALRCALLLTAAAYGLLFLVIWDPNQKLTTCLLPLLFGVPDQCLPVSPP